MLAALVTGLAFGLINGSLVAFAKLPFIVTLGALTAVRGIARLIGDEDRFNPDLPFAFIGSDTSRSALAGDHCCSGDRCRGSSSTHGAGPAHLLGRQQPEAARLSGIKVWKVLLFVYAMSGLFAGIGAIMTTSRILAANGLQFGQSYELDAIAAVILGGTSFVGGVGSIMGTLVGALIIAVLSNGLILVGVSDIWQYIVKGLVIIGAVALVATASPARAPEP